MPLDVSKYLDIKEKEDNSNVEFQLNPFKINGVIGRKHYLYTIAILNTLDRFFGNILQNWFNEPQYDTVVFVTSTLLLIAYIWVWYAATYKRVWDIKATKKNIFWWTILFMIPVVNLYIIFTKGEISENLYNNSDDCKNSVSEKYSTQNIKIDEKDLPQLNKFELLCALLAVPMAYIITIFSLVISLAFGAFIMWLFFIIETTLFGVLHYGILIIMGIGILISIFVAIKSIVLSFLNNSIFEISKALPFDSDIQDEIIEVCNKLKVEPPNNVLISFEPQFYVTQSTIKNTNQTFKGKTLVIGMPYIKYLTKNEFKSVIAHEIAHFTGNDTLFSIYVAPLYKNLTRILKDLSQYANKDSFWTFLPMLPVVFLLSAFLNAFGKLESKISRQREKRADYIAAILYGSENFKTALTKVSNVSFLFNSNYMKDYFSVIEKGKCFINYFAIFDKDMEKIDITKIDSDDTKTEEFDTHCSIQERFDYIPSIQNDSKETFLNYNLETLEKELSNDMGIYVNALIQRNKQIDEHTHKDN